MSGVPVNLSILPSPLVGEGQGEGPAASAAEKLFAGPPPNPPHKGEGLKRLSLAPDAIGKARALRRNPTDAETLLWRALRENFPDARFRRQVPLGPYFADFASHKAKLIVEVDGGQHAAALDQDQKRTAFLNAEGYRLLRFWNNEVVENLEGVLHRIAERAVILTLSRLRRGRVRT